MEKNKTYLSFIISGELFALHTDNVLNIIEIPNKITKVPLTPEYVMGVFNLRGESLSVIDSRKVLGVKEKEIDKDSVIIIIKHKEIKFGFLVDSVDDTMIVEDDEINSPTGTIRNDYVKNIINKNDKFIMVLDVTKTY